MCKSYITPIMINDFCSHQQIKVDDFNRGKSYGATKPTFTWNKELPNNNSHNEFKEVLLFTICKCMVSFTLEMIIDPLFYENVSLRGALLVLLLKRIISVC